MLKGKILSDYANLFCPNEYENNDKTILKEEKPTKILKILGLVNKI